MKTMIMIFILLLPIFTFAVPPIPYVKEKPNDHLVNLIIASSYDTIHWCKKGGDDCALMYIDPSTLPIFFVRENAAYIRNLDEAYYNAEFINMFGRELYNRYSRMTLTERANLNVGLRKISGIPLFILNYAAGPVMLDGKKVGVIGADAINIDSQLVYNKFMERYNFYLKHAGQLKKRIVTIGMKHQKNGDYLDVLFATALETNRLCHQMSVACAMNVVDTHGTSLLHFSQPNSTHISALVSRYRSATIGSVMFPHQWETRSERIMPMHAFKAFRVGNNIPIIPITPGEEALVFNNLSYGGIGVAFYPIKANPINWIRNANQLVHSLHQFVANHYSPPSACLSLRGVEHING